MTPAKFSKYVQNEKPKLKRRESKEGKSLTCHNISEPKELKETNL